MLPDVMVPVQEKTDVAAARRAALDLASFPEELAGKLSILVTEAASNLIKHAGGGQIVVRRLGASPAAGVEIIAMDKGPGMSNPARCFEDGYSTAGSPGTGLGAVSRIASFYDFYSAEGKGTVLVARVGDSAPKNGCGVELGAVGVAYPGEEISGDSWGIASRGSESVCRVIVADGLGHGVLAAEASDLAVSTAMNSSGLSAESLIEKCHGRMRATRGAAVSVADADFAAEQLAFTGVGNVSGAIVNESGARQQMISVNGTVGHELRRTQTFRYSLPPGSTVVLHSDGLSASWGLEKYPGLLQRHPTVIAAVLFRDFVRGRDDATVVVMRAATATDGHDSRGPGA
jgi:anti-sigma regulatory factor (Ser/Thr protein kinase)